MAKHPTPSQEKEEDRHPSTDLTGRFPVDELLRRHGFKILSRTTGREPVWVKRGDTYLESEALITIPPAQLDQAQAAEDHYLSRVCGG